MTTGPLSPPLASERALLRLSLPLGLIGPWHFWQRAFKSGKISCSRLGPAWGSAPSDDRCEHSQDSRAENRAVYPRRLFA